MTEIQFPPGEFRPALHSQAMRIEQASTFAEVLAGAQIAKQCPRSRPRAYEAMRDACRQMEVAESAFYRYLRDGEPITGRTVQLARLLASAWGNIQHGTAEVARSGDRSELMAWAWDVESNAQVSHRFIALHVRDTRDGSRALNDQRDIADNNSSIAARRAREAIFHVLPPQFVNAAQDLCHATLRDGGGKLLQERISEALAGFARHGVSETQLAAKIGKPVSTWDEQDVAVLRITFRSLERGEISKAAEFPPARITAADLAAPARAVSPPPAEAPAARRGKQQDKASDGTA